MDRPEGKLAKPRARMTGAEIEAVANKFLGLSLTQDEAAALQGPLEGLLTMVEQIERVALPYSAQPFITPGTADRWLEAWPESSKDAGTPRLAGGEG